MRVGVLTLCRDRLAYTQHCFQKLRENAGCAFDHFVLDQGSTDGTVDWLLADFMAQGPGVRRLPALAHDNLGISAGMNLLLEQVGDDYDVIVKMDNDCEVVTPNTLRDIATLVHESGDVLLSPVIHGLNRPPLTTRRRNLADKVVEEKQQIGGIFLAAPAAMYQQFRYSETNPVWGGDDGEVCAWWRDRGGWCGYVQGYDANHYETTTGQWDRFPAYFARTKIEGKAVL